MARWSGSQALGHFTPPTLRQLEDALDALPARSRSAVVTADLWDVGAASGVRAAVEPTRIERLRRMNLTGRAEPRVRVPRVRDAA